MSKSTGLANKYFVLKPRGEDIYAKASRVAMLTYAKIVHKEDELLSQQLVGWATAEELEYIVGSKWKGTDDEAESS